MGCSPLVNCVYFGTYGRWNLIVMFRMVSNVGRVRVMFVREFSACVQSISWCESWWCSGFCTSEGALQQFSAVHGRVVRDGGISKLYTGLLASIAVSAPSSAVFMACYECSKHAIEVATSGLPLPFHNFVPLLFPVISNVAASIVRVPPEVIKQRVQVGIYRYASDVIWTAVILSSWSVSVYWSFMQVFSKIRLIIRRPPRDTYRDLRMITGRLLHEQWERFSLWCCLIVPEKFILLKTLVLGAWFLSQKAKHHTDIFQVTRALWTTEGLSGFYCGYSMQLTCLIIRPSKCNAGKAWFWLTPKCLNYK